MREHFKLEEGSEVIINVPFAYSIGDEGPITGKILETVQDCKDEVEAELLNGLSGAIFMTADIIE